LCIFNKDKCGISFAERAPYQGILKGEYKISYIPDGEIRTIPSLSFIGSQKMIGNLSENI